MLQRIDGVPAQLGYSSFFFLLQALLPPSWPFFGWLRSPDQHSALKKRALVTHLTRCSDAWVITNVWRVNRKYVFTEKKFKLVFLPAQEWKGHMGRHSWRWWKLEVPSWWTVGYLPCWWMYTTWPTASTKSLFEWRLPKAFPASPLINGGGGKEVRKLWEQKYSSPRL